MEALGTTAPPQPSAVANKCDPRSSHRSSPSSRLGLYAFHSAVPDMHIHIHVHMQYTYYIYTCTVTYNYATHTLCTYIMRIYMHYIHTVYTYIIHDTLWLIHYTLSVIHKHTYICTYALTHRETYFYTHISSTHTYVYGYSYAYTTHMAGTCASTGINMSTTSPNTHLA